MKDKTIEPLPESFETAEQAGEFWDTHSTMELMTRYIDFEMGDLEISPNLKLQPKALPNTQPLKLLKKP